jgi:hypothetical protein
MPVAKRPLRAVNPMTEPCYLGIDPGQNGGIVLICGGHLYSASRMPDNDSRLLEKFKELSDFNIEMAYLEKLSPAPSFGKGRFSRGVVSQFKLGMSYGKLQMALTAAEIPFEEVIPRTWQSGLSITPRKKDEADTPWKNRLKVKAKQLYPKAEITLAISDATLIATYCQRKMEGKL